MYSCCQTYRELTQVQGGSRVAGGCGCGATSGPATSGGGDGDGGSWDASVNADECVNAARCQCMLQGRPVGSTLLLLLLLPALQDVVCF